MLVEWWASAPSDAAKMATSARAAIAPRTPCIGHAPQVTVSLAAARRLSLRGDDVAARIAGDLDKYVIAILVDALGIVALQADAFDDVELARPLAEPDARGLPRPRQHV